MNNKKEFRCYDLCCGAGVFSLGFRKAGVRIIGGIDIDRHAIETAKYNMPEGSWEQVSIQDLAKSIKKGHCSPVYKANVIIAGLPCQGFSVAGKCEPEDERNKLYKYLLKIVRQVMPEFVVIENVQGLLSKRNKGVFSDILNGLRFEGYNVDYRLYDAVNFRVPQYRKRIFIIASLDIPVKYVFENMHFSNKLETVKNALKGLDLKKEIPSQNHTFMKHSSEVINKIRKIKNGGPISYRRLKWGQPSVTIISGHNALPVHPEEHRAISNREAARIQGIPDSFILQGPRTEQTMLVANAVPFPLAYKIAKAIKNSHKLMNLCQGNLYKRLALKMNSNLGLFLAGAFINFYKKEGRKYAWRRIKNPRYILLTEILLQRTKSDMVKEIWKEIIGACRSSNNGIKVNTKILNKTLKKIGLYNRAKTIRILNSGLIKYFKGKIPVNYDELRNLPGVGIYMAAALRTFAFNIPDFPVDTNCFRFINRFFGIKIYGRKSEARQLREFMNTIIPKKVAKEFVYGFLDFCSIICSPRNPKCQGCFLNDKCEYNG